MGQAKQRGDFAVRQKQAIDAGRLKDNEPASYHSMPTFRVPGDTGYDVRQLTDQIQRARYSSVSSEPSPPYHVMSDHGSDSVQTVQDRIDGLIP